MMWQNFETIKDLSKPYLLKTGDILYVSIKSISPEVNTLFNPESGMEASSSSGLGYQKYTTPSGAYLYGYEIDANGNITLPMLGKNKCDKRNCKSSRINSSEES